MEVTSYLSEINLKRLAEVETWRRKNSQIQTTQPKDLEMKGKAYSNWKKKWSRAATLAGRRGWEIYCFFLIMLGEPCLSVDRRVTDDERI